ncbi:MAG: prepilin-type N-terminal cleavage/methylation domain-containing protein [Armatimonadetes bacterium]|nr:prepilin-type N-terminal cleavage/methylation domain-containing protein [Armatimonadota bacterium]
MSAQRGVTLAEILIAVAILAISLLVLIGLYPTGLQSVKEASALNGATFLAERLVEAERARPYPTIVSQGPLQFTVATVNNGQSSGMRYEYQILVTEIQDGIEPGAKDIVVQVSWDAGGGLKVTRLESEVKEP